MNKYRRQKGLTLLISLVTLALIGTILTNFLYQTSLHISSAKHRQSKVQCRYSAESGIIMASRLITNMLEEQQSAFIQSIYQSGEIPTAINKPENDFLDVASPSAFNFDSFVISKQTKIIGNAKVEIEIIDENAKLPLLWVLQSPFERINGYDKMKALYSALELDYKNREALDDLLKQSIRGVKMPQKKHNISPVRTFSGAQGVGGSRAEDRIPRWRDLSGNLPRELDELRKDFVTQISQNWVYGLKDNNYNVLKEKIPGYDQRTIDFISTWNHSRINLNTAPLEVIYAAFEPIGMTMQMAEDIVEFRKTMPLSVPNRLDLIESLRPISGAVKLCHINRSDTFTIRVTARLGQAQYKLYSCTVHTGGKIENLAVFAGD